MLKYLKRALEDLGLHLKEKTQERVVIEQLFSNKHMNVCLNNVVCFLFICVINNITANKIIYSHQNYNIFFSSLTVVII